jgi:hypothetical protein
MSGMLADDPFVNVFSPPTAATADQALTMTGNNNGTVTTTSAPVMIQAYQNTTTLSGVFDKWAVAPKSGWSIDAASTANLTVNAQATVYALALYRSCPVGYTWNKSQTISRCVANPPPVCTGGEVLDSNNQCACPAGRVLQGKICVIPPKCPTTCHFGCYLPFFKDGVLTINCKPAPR